MLNVGKGELLHLPVFGGPQVGAEAHAGLGGKHRRPYAQRQGHQGHYNHLQPGHQNIVSVSVLNADVHNVTHDLGQQQLQHGLSRRAQDAQYNEHPVPGGIVH